MSRVRRRALQLGEYTSFTAFFATLLLYSPNVIFSTSLPGFLLTIPSFVVALLSGVLVAGVFAVWRAMAVPLPTRISGRGVTLAALMYLLAQAILVWQLLFPLASASALGVFCGVLCGICSVVLLLEWAHHFVHFGLKQALGHLALLGVAGATINTLLVLLSGETACLIFLVLSVWGVLFPTAQRWLTQKPESNPQPPTEQKSSSLSRTLPRVFGKLMTVVLAPFIGFLLFALTMGVEKVIYFDAISGENLGALCAALLVIPLLVVRLEKPLLPFIYRVYLPLIAAGLIVIGSIFPALLSSGWGSLFLYAFYAFIGLIALGAFCATAHAQEFSVWLIFGLALAAFAACSLSGLALRELVLIEDFFVALVVLTTVYSVGLILVPGLRSWKTSFAPSGATPPTRELDLEERSALAAERFGLSKREAEVLGYLGRGYSPAYIAKTLFLSDSTVRSHVKSIYRKMNVHAQPELLQAVDACKRVE